MPCLPEANIEDITEKPATKIRPTTQMSGLHVVNKSKKRTVTENDDLQSSAKNFL